MTRDARQRGESGIYHVMLRGINQTQLFYDDDDRQFFLGCMSRLITESSFRLYAYALMGNHIHLLIQEENNELSLIVKRLTLSYSHRFNKKYDRNGYLFQGRFKSEPVDDETYLLAVARYIHQNPVKVGERIDSWTSYNSYMISDGLVTDGFILNMFAKDKARARQLFKGFMDESNGDELDALGKEEYRSLSDAQAIEILRSLIGVNDFIRLAEYERVERDRILARLKSEGLTIRQISRLTGINRGIVQRAKTASDNKR